jgi:hypothetical protein
LIGVELLASGDDADSAHTHHEFDVALVGRRDSDVYIPDDHFVMYAAQPTMGFECFKAYVDNPKCQGFV